MRWFVEISPLGKSEAEQDRKCVEASHWQEAIKEIRRATGMDDALRNFSIEVLDEGVRAVDPMSRLRYVIRQAPEDATLTHEPERAAEPAPPPKTASSAPPARKTNRLAQTMAYGSPGSAAFAQAVEQVQSQPGIGGPPAYTRAVHPPATSEPKPTPARVPSQPPQAQPPQAHPSQPPQAHPSQPPQAQASQPPQAQASHPPQAPPPTEPAETQVAPPPSSAFSVVAKREEEPSEASPLSYREYAFAIAEGSSEDDAEKFIVERFKEIRDKLSETQTAKLVNLAVFDHAFAKKPKRPPLVTLVWKSWKGGPEVRFTSRPGVSIPPPSLGKPVPASKPAPSAPAQPESAASKPAKSSKGPGAQTPVHTPPSTPAAIRKQGGSLGPPQATMRSAESPIEPSPSKPKINAKPVAEPAAQQSAPAVAAASPKTPIGDEIIADIFESMHDLHFLRDAYEGADFVISLALDKMRCKLGMAQLYDINRREFVVAHAVGPGSEQALGNRTSEHDPLLAEIMRRRTPFVIKTKDDGRVADGRWKNLGGEPQCILACAVAEGGRFLGIIEIAHGPGDGEFRKADIDGLAYIAQSFAEFVEKTGLMFGSEKNLMT